MEPLEDQEGADFQAMIRRINSIQDNRHKTTKAVYHKENLQDSHPRYLPV